jgi:hypothetical protein
MKKLNTWYWIVTVLFAAFMIFSAIPNVMMTQDSITFIGNGLGFPNYLIPFIGVAKLAGSVAILVPQFRRIKEWAYAGLFFDLSGAFYSLVAKNGFQPPMLVIVVVIGALFVSYFLWHKKIAAA